MIGEFEKALTILKDRIALVPQTDMSRACLASALGNLGRIDEARQIWSELLAIHPQYTYADGIGQMHFKNPDDLARIAAGLVRAGLCTADQNNFDGSERDQAIKPGA